MQSNLGRGRRRPKPHSLEVELLEDRQLLSNLNFLPGPQLLVLPVPAPAALTSHVQLDLSADGQAGAAADAGLMVRMANIAVALRVSSSLAASTTPGSGSGSVSAGAGIGGGTGAGATVSGEADLGAHGGGGLQLGGAGGVTLVKGADLSLSAAGQTTSPSSAPGSGATISLGDPPEVRPGIGASGLIGGGGGAASFAGSVSGGGLALNLGLEGGRQVGGAGGINVSGPVGADGTTRGVGTKSGGGGLLDPGAGNPGTGSTVKVIGVPTRIGHEGRSAIALSLLGVQLPLAANSPGGAEGGGMKVLPGGTAGAATPAAPPRLEPPAPPVGESEAAATDEDLSPQAPDLLDGFAPFDPASVDGVFQQLLDQINDLGRELAHLLAGTALCPWLIAAVVTVVACEMIRRQTRRTRGGLALAGAGGGAVSPWWVLGLTDLTPPEEP